MTCSTARRADTVPMSSVPSPDHLAFSRSNENSAVPVYSVMACGRRRRKRDHQQARTWPTAGLRPSAVPAATTNWRLDNGVRPWLPSFIDALFRLAAVVASRSDCRRSFLLLRCVCVSVAWLMIN